MKILMGRISEIDELKSSRNGGAYLRVYFQMKVPTEVPQFGLIEPKKAYFWAKTDIVPTFRNYPRWRDLLQKGNVLANLQMKTEDTVDADSYPKLLGTWSKEPEMVPLQKSLWKK